MYGVLLTIRKAYLTFSTNFLPTSSCSAYFAARTSLIKSCFSSSLSVCLFFFCSHHFVRKSMIVTTFVNYSRSRGGTYNSKTFSAQYEPNISRIPPICIFIYLLAIGFPPLFYPTSGLPPAKEL
jgi:hypothetical protein